MVMILKKIFLTIIIITAIIISSYLGFKSTTNNSDDTGITDTVLPDVSRLEEAYVKRVVDGDTIIATINNEDYRVRFIGINTPESTTKIEEYGKEASKYTTDMLLYKTVYLEKDVSNTDKYDRLLRYIWLEIPNEISKEEITSKMFNAILLKNGYATLYTFPPDVKYVTYLKSLEREARESNKGLWQLKKN